MGRPDDQSTYVWSKQSDEADQAADRDGGGGQQRPKDDDRALVTLDLDSQLLAGFFTQAEGIQAVAEQPPGAERQQHQWHDQCELAPLCDRHTSEQPAIDTRQVEL